jgi:hypothetical protein
MAIAEERSGREYDFMRSEEPTQCRCVLGRYSPVPEALDDMRVHAPVTGMPGQNWETRGQFIELIEIDGFNA